MRFIWSLLLAVPMFFGLVSTADASDLVHDLESEGRPYVIIGGNVLLTPQWVEENKHFVVYEYEDYYAIMYSEIGSPKGGQIEVYDYVGDTWVIRYRTSFAEPFAYGSSITGNTDIRTLEGGFFFSVPAPDVLEIHLPRIPMTMKEVLVDGGVISVALVILAILLGVLLVRRFPFWFLR